MSQYGGFYLSKQGKMHHFVASFCQTFGLLFPSLAFAPSACPSISERISRIMASNMAFVSSLKEGRGGVAALVNVSLKTNWAQNETIPLPRHRPTIRL